MYSRILVAVDGSECARNAFNSAAGMAESNGATLIVLCVVHPPMVIGQRKETAERFVRILEKEARIILADYATEAESAGLKVETKLAKGHPAKMILDTAKTKDVDLIVIGSRGMGSVKGLLLGSVSNAVVNNSKVPVMVVKN